MEFLKSCTTNAQAIGDFEAIAYQAVSIARTTTSASASSKARPWPATEDVRAAEAELRHALHLVAHDASRPWLWLFKPTTVDKIGQTTLQLPDLDGYRLQREHTGAIKAIDLVRPPMRPGTPHTAAASNQPTSTNAPQRGSQGVNPRPAQGNTQSQASSDPPQPPDCFTLYELFTSSVIALISFQVVKNCDVVALNYRTFVSKATKQIGDALTEVESQPELQRLTSIHAHWTSSGTLLLSTFTDQKNLIRCLSSVSTQAEERQLTGRCIRVAPNGLLATITSFEDPLDSITEEIGVRHRKRTKVTSLEQSIEKWKSTVKRWLGWKGYALPDLDKRSSWVRIRTTLTANAAVSSPASVAPERDVLWPRALCFFHVTDEPEAMTTGTNVSDSNVVRWFETPESTGFKDPLDAAQEWFLGKPDRDKILEARRKAKKAEEDAARRKEEHPSLHPSSPLNARTGAYGDLQAVGGVYPTPPDGVAPGTGVSYSDTPSVSGTASNIILPPGGNNPAINLSAPTQSTKADDQMISTSPAVPSAVDNFNTSSGNDDLFGDMDEDGYGGGRINDTDFDFFDGPDNDDVDMLDAPALPDESAPPADTIQDQPSGAVAEPHPQDDMSDPFAALENALATASEPPMAQGDVKGKDPAHMPAPKVEDSGFSDNKKSSPRRNVSFSKAPTPPLSPSKIFKALEPSPTKRPVSRTRSEGIADGYRDAQFDPVAFNRKMSLSDAKYQGGRFSANRPRTQDRQREPSPTPTLNTASQPKFSRDFPLLSKLRLAAGIASANKIPEIASLARAASVDSDSSSEASDVSDEDSGDEEAEATPAVVTTNIIMPAKRKLQSEGNATPMSVTSFADSLGGDWLELYGLHLDEAVLSSFEPSLWDWSLVNVPSPAERLVAGARYSLPALLPSPAQMPDTPTSQPDPAYEVPDEKPLSGKECISITQIVTDQIVSTTLDMLGEDSPIRSEFGKDAVAEKPWNSVIKEIFPTASDCDLPTLVGVNEVFQDYAALVKAQQRPPARKNDGPAVTGSHMYQIQAPFLRVRRAETHWDLLPPAVAFWEPLGLSPISAPKNIVAFCVYPHSDAIRPCLESFLLNLQLAYDGCKLGNHSRVETVVEFEGGLVPVRATSAITPRDTFKLLKETCIQLGKLLAFQHGKIREQQPDSKVDAFVIYMIDPFGGPSAVWELCSAFWALFQAYTQGHPGRPDQPQKPDVVLQIIPIKYIASFDAPVVLDPSTYFSLAREVYDRCPPSAPSGDKTSLSIYKAPAFHLEEILPRNIPFKLISEPAQDLLRENTYMHLGYAVSLDGTWVTAAWTDSCGKSQAVVSYHLGTRMFREIAKEIWQTTIEILQSRRVNWRVCIAKAGVLEREELETWVFLISCPTQINVFVTLLTAVDADPPYQFTPTVPVQTTTGAGASTPVSTPQAGVSPSDPGPGLTPAATPAADPTATDPAADPEARLVDVTDDTWGVILAHRLHNSHSSTQFSPALISGLLVKRGETIQTSNSTAHPIPDPEQGPIVVAVNFLWIGAVGSSRNATNSPFPPTSSSSTPSSSSASDLPSPGGSNLPNPYASNPGTPQSPGPGQEGQRSTTSLMWTPTPQTRTTAEGLLKEVLGQFRALGLLAKLRGMRGTRNGTIPWHVAAAKRGVEGLGKIGGGSVGNNGAMV